MGSPLSLYREFRHLPRPIAAAGAALAIASCQPDRSSENASFLAVPGTWTGANTGRTKLPLSNTGWIDDLPGKHVRTLSREAVTGNFDLRAAAARMRQAKARSIVENSRRWPAVDAGFDPTRRQNAGNSSDSNTSTLGNDFSLALGLSWEVDLWGRLRDGYTASRADYEAARSDYEAARLSIAANTAKAYYNAVAAEQQRALSQGTLDSFEDTLEVVREIFQRGIDDGGNPALDLSLARADVAAAEASVQNNSRNRDTAGRSLEALLGRYPANGVEVAGRLPSLSPSDPVPAGLPSELLLRRPDILAAEQRLAAAGYRVNAARKAFLPSISLTGRYGWRSSDLADLLQPEQIIWNIAAGLTQPIFRSGELRGELDLAKAQEDELLQNYAATALEALREVETALAAEAYLAREEAALQKADADSSRAEAIAREDYGRGLVDFVTVLTSQRRAFEARRAVITIRNDRLQNRVDLHLALGGDFDTVPSTRIAPAGAAAPEKDKPARPSPR